MSATEPMVEIAVAPASQAATLASRLVRGSAVYGAATFATKALSFVLLPLYTRFLTPADYGTISLAETIAAVLAACFGLGLEPGMRRMYFQYVGDREQLGSYLSSVLRFAAASTAVIAALAMLGGPPLLRLLDPRFSVPFFPYAALAIVTAALAHIVQYRLGLYQAEERPRSYALLAALTTVCTAAGAIVLVVFVRWGALGMLVGKLIAAVVAAAAALALLWRWVRQPAHWRYVRETLPLTLPLIPHNLMALGLVVADRFILEHYRTLAEVGLYSLAYTFGMVMYMVAASIGQAWQPIFFDAARDDGSRNVLGRMSSALAIFLTAVAVFGSLIAHDFTRVLDPRYRAVGGLIPWIIAGYLLHAWFGLFQLSAWQGKRTKFILLASLLACATNIALNLWWIPRWGMYGAAYATAAAYALEALLMYVYAQRVYRLAYQWVRLAGALAVFAAALVVAQLDFRTSLRPLLMLAALAASFALLWLLGGHNFGQVVRLVRRRA
jgi:O-antigen/teichoic acid export membrane protein